DFGIGYSSLGRLRQVPIDVIKIDRSLVSLISTERDEGPMVTAVIQLARSLGLVPVAEGIETEEQRRYVVSQGCTLGQGHLFSQALPGDQIMSWFDHDGLTLASPGRGQHDPHLTPSVGGE